MIHSQIWEATQAALKYLLTVWNPMMFMHYNLFSSSEMLFPIFQYEKKKPYNSVNDLELSFFFLLGKFLVKGHGQF